MYKNPEGEPGNLYYLDNYRKLQNWNLQNNQKIDEALQKLMAHLHLEEEDDVKYYFNMLSCLIADLLNNSLYDQSGNQIWSEVCFLGEREDNILVWDKDNDGIVYRQKETILDMIASNMETSLSEQDERQRKKFALFVEAARTLARDLKDFQLACYKNDDTKCIVVVSYGNHSNSQERIWMAILLNNDVTEYQKVRALRYILAVRSRIDKQINAHFRGGLLSLELRDAALNAQMGKARAGDHSQDEDLDIISDPKVFANSLMSGKSTENFEYKEKEATYGLYINATMGRINMKLLTNRNKNFSENTFCFGGISFNNTRDMTWLVDKLVDHLASIVYIPRRSPVKIITKNGEDICFKEDTAHEDLKKYMKILFQNRNLRINIRNEVPAFRYLTVLLSELINSARYGKLEGGVNIVKLDLDDAGYLYVSNETSDEFDEKNIEEGLKRLGDGISLASTCEFFDVFYNENDEVSNSDKKGRVKIKCDGKRLQIGLPIFQERI